MSNKNKKIILSGGGTGGSVTPILAISKELKKQDETINFVFVGTKNGPERTLVASFEQFPIPFRYLPAGKFRRYLSFKNISDIWNIILAFFKSFPLLLREKPDLIISAGSFASVPLVYAAFILRIPILIHQQDIRPGLANKLMAPLARVITVVFEKSLIDYGPKAVLTGNPLILPETYYWPENVDINFFKSEKKLLLCIGGGTGAKDLNKLIYKAKDSLVGYCNIIHLSGKDKDSDLISSDGYKVIDFLEHDKVLSLIKRADLVISRCGLGVLTELSAFKKPAILIPMPKSHQEDNADIFVKNDSAILLNQEEISSFDLTNKVKETLNNKEKLNELSENIYKIMKKGAETKIAAIIWEIIK